MSINTYLKLLKLASKFTDKKDFRQFSSVVNVKRENACTIIEATQGHVAIRITLKEPGMNPEWNENKKYTVDSIDKSNKVGIDLLETVKDDFRFPDLNKVFNNHTGGSNYAQFDVYLLNKVIAPLTDLCKALKVKLPRLNILNLDSEGATKIQLNLIENVVIDIAIMPLKPSFELSQRCLRRT